MRLAVLAGVGIPLRRVGSEGQDAFVGIDHVKSAIDPKGNHGDGARGRTGARTYRYRLFGPNSGERV